jgi:hypothetical protein
MKITNKTLMVSFETEVKLGNNDAIELTLQHQAFIGEDGIDIDLGIDIKDAKFLGIGMENSYQTFRDFKANLLKLGINLDELIIEKEQELMNSGLEDKLKLMFKDKF